MVLAASHLFVAAGLKGGGNRKFENIHYICETDMISFMSWNAGICTLP
jgi:hypothetical protein